MVYVFQIYSPQSEVIDGACKTVSGLETQAPMCQ